MDTIYLDFDNTIVESNKKIIEILNKKYNISKTESDLFDFHYNSIYPISVEEKLELFESDEFYNGLELKPFVLDVLNKYKDSYNIVIVSVGTKKNLEKKEKWIQEHIGNDFPFIGIEGKRPIKRQVNMEGAIQIDDVFESLDTNAMLKILYKSYNDFPWQQPKKYNEYMVVNSWEEIDSILGFYKKYNCKTLEKKKK